MRISRSSSITPDSPARIRTGVAGSRVGLIDYRALRNEFVKWLRSRIDEKTADKYVKLLDRYLTKPVTSPEEFAEIVSRIDKPGVRRWFVNAFRNLLNYLEAVKGWDETILTKYRKVAKTEKPGVREVYITTDELIEAYQHIQPKYRTLFKLITYSGLRCEHAVELLRTFNPDDLVIKDDLSIARYPIAWVSKGQKRSYWAYFPLRFVDELERIELKSGTAKEGIRYGRVSASTIRKWQFNFMIENGVPESVADFIQGRASVTVGSSHYLAKTRQADMFYSKIADKFPI